MISAFSSSITFAPSSCTRCTHVVRSSSSSGASDSITCPSSRSSSASRDIVQLTTVSLLSRCGGARSNDSLTSSSRNSACDSISSSPTRTEEDDGGSCESDSPSPLVARRSRTRCASRRARNAAKPARAMRLLPSSATVVDASAFCIAMPLPWSSGAEPSASSGCAAGESGFALAATLSNVHERAVYTIDWGAEMCSKAASARRTTSVSPPNILRRN